MFVENDLQISTRQSSKVRLCTPVLFFIFPSLYFLFLCHLLLSALTSVKQSTPIHNWSLMAGSIVKMEVFFINQYCWQMVEFILARHPILRSVIWPTTGNWTDLWSAMFSILVINSSPLRKKENLTAVRSRTLSWVVLYSVNASAIRVNQQWVSYG